MRAVLCPDKLNTDAVARGDARPRTRVGLRSTATIMFGHVDRHRALGAASAAHARPAGETGGFTEFVPLPFVHMESADLSCTGSARKGPTFREAVLMHAVARLVLDPVITNIQASWVKMGPDGAAVCLDAGANDLGGTLMNEMHHARGRRRARPGDAARGHGGADPRRRPHAAPAHHDLWRPQRRTHRHGRGAASPNPGSASCGGGVATAAAQGSVFGVTSSSSRGETGRAAMTYDGTVILRFDCRRGRG